MASKKRKAVTKKQARAERTNVVIPVVEEQLKLGKRQVVTGRVTLHKTVEEYLETVDLPLTEKRLTLNAFQWVRS